MILRTLIELLFQRQRRPHTAAPLTIQRKLRDRPAAILRADQVRCWHTHNAKKDFKEKVKSDDRAEQENFDPRRVQIDPDEAVARLWPPLAARAQSANIQSAQCACGQIRTCTGFRKPLASQSQSIARQDEMVDLRGGSEAIGNGTHHFQECTQWRCIGIAELFLEGTKLIG